ncbi:unnamed protein product [Mytilus coruscus]|uniref:Uncharacterized protein n=1 Tax=Mytilus coruscus TaxID=42192 RepID=A0A6J8AB94_MYTCO|nr:unnamed protein product [Mytilus coruscus]
MHSVNNKIEKNPQSKYCCVIMVITSKDIDQISYTEARIEDLRLLTNKIRYGDVDLIFKLRLFSGDGPARQFEAGQQRGETLANSDDRSDSFAKQDSTISRQAKRLPHRKNTIFTKKLLSGKSSVVQSHLARIAEFIIPGDQIWWHYDGENVQQSNPLQRKAIPPKKHNDDILDDLSTTEEPIMQDNEQEVEEPALILYDKESCSNQEEQTSILSGILPEQNKCPPIQESGKNTVTLTAEVHYAFAADPFWTKSSEQGIQIISSCGDHEPSSGKKTPLDLAVRLLGKTPEVLECIKYKGLMQNHPSHEPFSMKYDKLFSKPQIDISAKYHELKNKLNNSKMHGNMEKENADLKIAQKLLDHWRMYYF